MAPLVFLEPLLLLPKMLNTELPLVEFFEFTVFLFVGGGDEFPKGIRLLKEIPLFIGLAMEFTAELAALTAVVATEFAALAVVFTTFIAVVTAELAALETLFATALIAPATGYCPKGFKLDAFISNVICQNYG